MTSEVPLYLSRYPGYDVLKQQDDWDDKTRKLVLKRVREVPPIRFFTPAEADTLRALADTLLPQDDRPENLRIPIVNYLDARLREGKGDGWRDERLPPDPDLWRGLAAALDDEATRGFDAARFADLPPAGREEICRRLHDAALRETLEEPAWGDYGAVPLFGAAEGGWQTPEPTAPPLTSPHWERLPPRWLLPFVLWEVVGDYYAHPYAWNEIGFGGPKFPHIYPRPLKDNPDEAQEVHLGRTP